MNNNYDKVSWHCCEERTDRMVYIATTIGFGEIVVEHYQATRSTWACVTDTGVVFIKDFYKKKIITGYIGTYDQILAICSGNIPFSLKKVVKSNMKKKLHIIQDRVVY